MPNPIDAVGNYFFAKDGNRPHLMRRAFTEDAELEMIVKTDAISFPQSAVGVDAIAYIFGRRFADDFENVYTFGLARPTTANRKHFPCHWLVGMSAKRNGPIRVGCGRYDYYFTPDERCLIERLIITIEVMSVIPEAELDDIMTWLSGIPYPWCTPEEAVGTMPRIDGLAAIALYLNEIQPLLPDRYR